MTYEAFLSCVHPDDREYVDVKWQAALQGEAYDIEHRILVGGEVKWVCEKAELEFDELDLAVDFEFDGSFNRWYLDPLFRGRYPEDAAKPGISGWVVPGTGRYLLVLRSACVFQRSNQRWAITLPISAIANQGSTG